MDRLSELVKELTALLEELTRVEERKLEAARDGKVVVVEDCMKEEQVYTMQFRACEKKLDGVLAAEGFTGMSLGELLPRLPQERREALEPLQSRLRETLAYYHEVSDAAAELLKIQLHKLEKQVEEVGKAAGKDTQGHEAAPSKNFHPRKA